MRTVKDILEAKGQKVWTIGPEHRVFAALELMAEKDVGALVVVVEGGRVAGIISERDYARKVILKGASSREIQVKDVMTAQVVCIEPERTIEDCMAIMTEKRIRHLPVLQKGRLAGLISIGDVVKAVMAEKEFTISQLENYILTG
jgi:CBS domain-containing protein